MLIYLPFQHILLNSKMQRLDLKNHVKTMLVNSDDVACDKFGNWSAGFKSQLSDLHSKHGSELIDTLKECIL